MIREAKSRYPVTALTHPGMTGKNNEDRFAVSAFHLSRRNRTPVLLAVLCDGIGGHKAGEIAADLAVNHISQVVAESDGKFPLETLEKGIQLANQAIFQEANNDIGKQGMGSTTACVWLIGNKLFTATVGDSRIYLIRGDRIRQLSIDHTWLQDALDNGLITPEQMEGHPNRHVIRRYLGAPQPPEVDFRMRLANGETNQQMLENQGKPLIEGDRILLCSDGLTDLVSDAEIMEAFSTSDEKKAVSNLIDLANSRGGHDNITIVTFSIPGGIKPAGKKKTMIPYGCAVAAIILGIIVIVVSAYFLWKGLPWQKDSLSATPPVLSTINPMITSAPQPSATLDLSITLPAATNTSTPFTLPTRDLSGANNYPAPNNNANPALTPSAYP
ncbi:MAG: PP2C family protein-serine/threonine phosphatase [Anaerolineaceae bacterium]